MKIDVIMLRSYVRCARTEYRRINFKLINNITAL